MANTTAEDASNPGSGRDTASVADPAHQVHLRGNLSTSQLVFTVLSYNAPLAAVAGVVPIMIAYGNGIGAPSILLLVGAVMVLFSVGFTAMSKYLPNAGAFYSYVTAGLGKRLGLGTSFVALATYCFGICGWYAYSSIAVSSLVRDTFHGPDLPWWTYALALALIVTVLGFRQLDTSAKVMAVVLTAEVIVVVVYDLVVLGHGGGPEGFRFGSFVPQNVFTGVLGVAIIYAATSFVGFEATAVFRDEVRDPERTVPRATFIVIGGVTIFFTLTAWLMIQASGQSRAVESMTADPTGTFLGGLALYAGTIASDIATVLLVSSTFAGLLATHNVIARYLFNLGADRVLSPRLGVAHPRFGSPHRASIVLSGGSIAFVVVVAALGTDPVDVYAKLTGVGTYGFMLLMFLAAVSICVYLARFRRAELGVWRSVVAPVAAALALGALLTLATLNLPVLAGTAELAIFVLIVVMSALVVGVVLASVFKRTRPETYARIGRQ